MPTGAVFHAYFDPERDMPAEAEAVHGLSVAFLTGKPKFVEQAQDLIAFLGEAPLIAHNAAFDFGFLNAELAAASMTPVSLDRMIDTIAIARRKHPGAKLSLDALCSRYGIDRSHRTKHGALLDAELLAQLYIELMGGRQIGLELAADAVAAADAGAMPAHSGLTIAPRPFRAARLHRPSDAELARHETFMAGFGDPLWTRG